MKKQEFVNKLKKRLKYAEENDDSVNNVFGWQNSKGGYDLKRHRIDVAEIDHTDHREVYRDTVFFWVQNEDRPAEKILDVRWIGIYSRIDKEIEAVISDQGIYSKNERAERRKDRERILEKGRKG